MKFEVNFHSLRSKKARLASMIKPTGLWVLLVTAAGFSLLGLYLGITNDNQLNQPAYLCMSISLFLLVIALWYRYDLSNNPVPKVPNTLDDILEPRLLAKLSKPVNPQTMWNAAINLGEGRFICNHLYISSKEVDGLLGSDEKSAETIWKAADYLREKTNSPLLNAGTLAAALLLTSPDVMKYLERLKINDDEVVEVHAWLQRLAQYLDQPKPYFGGVGRDWATGFTPTLDEFGQNISRGIERGRGGGHNLASNDKVSLIVHNLAEGNANVALVGSAGTGKTSLIYSVAEKLITGGDKRLKYYQIVSLNASSILSRSGGNLERVILTMLAEAIHAKNIILFFDDAQLFFGQGTGAFDLSQILLPIMRNQRLKIIAAFTPGDFQRLKATNESLISGFSVININEPELPDTYKILEDFALILEHRANVLIPYESIKESVRLSGQFMQDQSYPGKAITLLEQAVPFASNKVLSEESVQQAVEKSLGVKVGAAAAPEADVLLHLEDHIHERMVNQNRAVEVVASALRRGRAGVSSPNKPIGSFLFLGPTGVGKTELARSLAATYFKDEHRMIRLDMSEYQQVSDVSRLLADGRSGDQNLLMGIRQQPFSVVLLDEIEKAHPNILNLLLQMLDEGQLTDNSGKPASFKNAIIICTSNAGASDIAKAVEAGTTLESFERPLVDKLIQDGQFRPELINRFDEVVLFRSLNEEELTQVAKIMLRKVGANLSQRNIHVQITDEALSYIVKAGYDPQFGTRPMRRVIQKTVEDAVATRILQGTATPGSVITLDVKDLQHHSVQEK